MGTLGAFFHLNLSKAERRGQEVSGDQVDMELDSNACEYSGGTGLVLPGCRQQSTG